MAAGNFSLTAAMAQAAALLVARHLPHREIVDYASAAKPDAPGGTARELAERLADVRPNAVDSPPDQTRGAVESCETTVGGTLLAVRAVAGRTGLTRGLDTLLLES